jgi:hypothetical protein
MKEFMVGGVEWSAAWDWHGNETKIGIFLLNLDFFFIKLRNKFTNCDIFFMD